MENTVQIKDTIKLEIEIPAESFKKYLKCAKHYNMTPEKIIFKIVNDIGTWITKFKTYEDFDSTLQEAALLYCFKNSPEEKQKEFMDIHNAFCRSIGIDPNSL